MKPKKQSSPTFSFFGFKIVVRKCVESSIFVAHQYYTTSVQSHLPLKFLQLSHGCHLSVHFFKRLLFFIFILEHHFYVFCLVIMTIQLTVRKNFKHIFSTNSVIILLFYLSLLPYWNVFIIFNRTYQYLLIPFKTPLFKGIKVPFKPAQRHNN